MLENDGRNRVVRLVASASHRLARAGVPSAQVWREVSCLAKELAKRVLDAPDPERDPSAIARWRERAMEAFRASGSPLLMDLDVEQDVRFESRPAIKRRTL
jgi:phosphosulfolactate phosphohydrolase-like enzyme